MASWAWEIPPTGWRPTRVGTPRTGWRWQQENITAWASGPTAPFGPGAETPMASWAWEIPATASSLPRWMWIMTGWRWPRQTTHSLGIQGQRLPLCLGLKTVLASWAWETTSTGTYPTSRSWCLRDWVAVAAGAYHSLAIKANGSLYAWGANGSGQLGLGAIGSQNIPAAGPRRILTGWRWPAGQSHSLGRRANGSLYAWGDNALGQLGLGSIGNQTTPTQVGSDTDWVAVAAGANHSLGRRANGSLYAWGYNASGQLGLDSYDNQNTPQPVGSGTDWVAAGGGRLPQPGAPGRRLLLGLGL